MSPSCIVGFYTKIYLKVFFGNLKGTKIQYCKVHQVIMLNKYNITEHFIVFNRLFSHLFYLFFYANRDQIQDLVLARQALVPLSYFPSPHFILFFETRSW